MASSTLQNITEANPDEIYGMINASIRSYDADASNRDDASASVVTAAAAAAVRTIPTCSEVSETPIESHELHSSARNSNPVSDDERLLAAVREVVRSIEAIHARIAALEAKLESFRTIERQRSAEAGPQTSARGQGGAADALGTSPQGPQQCVHCGGPSNEGRIAEGARESGEMGSETSAVTSDHAGAIPRPVASRPDNEHTDGGEEAQAEAGTNQNARRRDKPGPVMWVLITIALLYNYLLTLAFEACEHPVNVTPRINCGAGIEVASSFCREKKCVEAVKYHCKLRLDCTKRGRCALPEDLLDRDEKKIIADFL